MPPLADVAAPAGRREAALCYALAALFGVVLVARMFPLAALDGTVTLVRPMAGDSAQHIVGQRYFLADRWHWPPLTTRLIEPPAGVDIALTDSIPLAALAGRPFARLLPHGGHLVYAWLALCFGVQAAAGVLALRAAGVRGVVAPVAGGIIAGCMPALLIRFGHAALCAHFTLLLAVALYFRMVATRRARLWLPGTALTVAALLIHPYLMAMVTVILAAGPLSLALRGELRAAARMAAAMLGGMAVLLGVAALGGYLGADRATGFGHYSLNLLAPFVPAQSALLPGFAVPDATGGQYEGFSYLGLGLLALLPVAAAALRRRVARRWIGQHAGLFAVAALAGVYALSDTVYAGRHLLFHLPAFPVAVEQFRASGRFVWVGLYVGAVAVTMLASLGLGRWTAVVLAAAALLQYADTRDMRGVLAAELRQPLPWAVDPAFYRPLMARHRRLTIWPTAACEPQRVNDNVFMHLLLFASEVALPVNTVPTARTVATDRCDTAEISRPGLLPGELRLLLPGYSPNLVATVPGLRELCHPFPAGTIGCTADPAFAGAATVQPDPFVLDRPMSLGEPLGARLRGLGWTDVSVNGAWTIGPVATLMGALPPAPAGLRLTVMAHGMAAPGRSQQVRVEANGQPVATWQVTPGDAAPYGAELPAALLGGGLLTLTLRIADPTRPDDVTGGGDMRPLGLYLHGWQLQRP